MNWLIRCLPLTRRQTPPQCVSLRPGGVLCLRHPSGQRIVCQHGRVWITASGCRDDVFLSAGEGWTPPAAGLVVIEAETASRLRLGC